VRLRVTARADSLEAARRVGQEVETLYTNGPAGGGGAVAATRERVQLAEQEVSQASERFRAGVAGNADVFTASISLNGARTQVVDALAAYQTSRIALARAQGKSREIR